MASRSTIFIAVQCCQCSTMQVKQKKKSNNKWNCALCNQKQSVRKVFAEGFMAKDIRKFVQSFNMSRKSLEDQSLYLETLDPTSQEEILNEESDELLANQMKKRSDWTEYLDQQGDSTKEEYQNGSIRDDSELKVVTELRTHMFKKPRLESYSIELETGVSDKPFKPTFSKRNAEKYIISQEKPPIKDQQSMAKSKSKLESNRSDQGPQIQTVYGSTASKWNNYITKDDDDDSQLVGWKRALKDHNASPLNTSDSILEAITDEQCVQDDIHPDFM